MRYIITKSHWFYKELDKNFNGAHFKILLWFLQLYSTNSFLRLRAALKFRQRFAVFLILRLCFNVFVLEIDFPISYRRKHVWASLDADFKVSKLLFFKYKCEQSSILFEILYGKGGESIIRKLPIQDGGNVVTV